MTNKTNEKRMTKREECVSRVKALHGAGYTLTEIAQLFKVSESAIRSMVATK